MAKLVSFNINLVPRDPFFNTYLGKTLKWALSVGRYIVIFTELIVILSFVSRFTLDRQITDLNDSIHQKQIVIESYGDLETTVRTIQTKIDHYQQIEQQVNILDTFPALTKITPAGILLEQLAIRPDQVSLIGTTLSQDSLNTLINNIQLLPYFTDVVVNKIESDQENDGIGFRFQISAATQQNIAPTAPTNTAPVTPNTK